MKKQFFLLVGIILFSVNILFGYNFSAVNSGKTIYYNFLYSNRVEVASSPFYTGSINIPDSVAYNGNTYHVIGIAGSSFFNCSGLTSISIPNSVTYIGANAFENCTGLTSITIPNSVTSIGNSAFSKCKGFTSITIPNSVTTIGDNAFYWCDKLTSIAIPNSVLSLGEHAFAICTSLATVSIGSSIPKFKPDWFQTCNSLMSIVVDSNNAKYSSSNGIVFSKNQDTLVCYPPGKKGSYSVSNNVISIAPKAFFCSNYLTSVTITNSTLSIGDSAFEGCNGLQSISLPNSITKIGNSVFKDCTQLTSIVIPKTVTSIGNTAFYYCHNLKSISIPDSVTSIGEYAFTWCAELPSIFIPNSVKSIGKSAFAHCDSLSMVTMSNSLISIGDYAFYLCYKIKAITLPNTLVSIGANAFRGCEKISSLIIPNSVTSLGDYAFIDCTGLNSISISNSLNVVPLGAFGYCTSLTSVTIPNSVDSISKEAFYSCTSLNKVIIPNSVTYIGESCFYNCTGLLSIYFLANNPPTIASQYIFYQVPAGFKIYVPCASMNLYSTAPYWSSFSNKFPVKSYQNITTSICQGQQYTQYGANIDTAGVYNLVYGCDSVKLTLTVNTVYSTIIYDTICKGQKYNKFGFNFIADTIGVYIQSLKKTTGCDSVLSLSLIVTPIYSIEIFDTICKGQMYNKYGFNFIADTSGIYIQNLLSMSGCDSIIILNLLLNTVYSTTFYDTICQGLLYNKYGFNFIADTSGINIYKIYTFTGCDSITLILNVNSRYSTIIYDTICKGQQYNNYGFNLNADTSGVYSQNLQTINGCDSIITLNLIVNTIFSKTIYDTICQGQVYNKYGFNFNADTAGSYIQNLQTINGCDSIVILNLTLNSTPSIPSNLKVYPQHNYLEIIWQGDASKYEIYRNNILVTVVDQSIYLDYNVISSTAYCYKIKAISGDCVSEFSKIMCKSFVGLENEIDNNISVKLYPNPTNKKAILSIENGVEMTEVQIIDMYGKIVDMYKLEGGKSQLEINVEGLAKGIYNICIISGKDIQTKKLIVE
ncbi:MAG: leucine-rich repeat protein [Bacteroidetes bacterium]|nr:leucine-rich repeat protein [Bacteroidota bacterium]